MRAEGLISAWHPRPGPGGTGLAIGRPPTVTKASSGTPRRRRPGVSPRAANPPPSPTIIRVSRLIAKEYLRDYAKLKVAIPRRNSGLKPWETTCLQKNSTVTDWHHAVSLRGATKHHDFQMLLSDLGLPNTKKLKSCLSFGVNSRRLFQEPSKASNEKIYSWALGAKFLHSAHCSMQVNFGCLEGQALTRFLVCSSCYSLRQQSASISLPKSAYSLARLTQLEFVNIRQWGPWWLLCIALKHVTDQSNCHCLAQSFNHWLVLGKTKASEQIDLHVQYLFLCRAAELDLQPVQKQGVCSVTHWNA